MFNQSGHLTLGHKDSAITGLRVRAENNRLMGIDSRMVDPDEIRRMVPTMDVRSSSASGAGRALPSAGRHHRPRCRRSGIGHACDPMGIEMHPYTTVTGMKVEDGKVVRIRTTRETWRRERY